jgi:hypothetical protein
MARLLRRYLPCHSYAAGRWSLVAIVLAPALGAIGTPVIRQRTKTSRARNN